MQTAKRVVEWYLGIPPANPGQGTDWNFSAKNPWPDWLPAWGALLAALAIFFCVVWVYLRDANILTWWKCLGLISLRMATICLLFVLLTELTLAVDRTGLPFVAVLVDESASMGLEDQYADSIVQEQATLLVTEAKFKGLTRLNLAKAILTRQAGRFLKRLQDQHKVRLYRFADSAIHLGRAEYINGDQIDQLLPLLNSLKAHGDQTRPGPAVRKVLNDFRGSPPSAIVILTDGIASTTDADKLTVGAELALKKLVPIFTVGIGSEEPARDLQLYDVLVDDVVFVNDPVTFSAKLKGFGFKSRIVTVTLKQDGSSEILSSQPVKVGADGQSVKFELTHTPSQKGEFDFLLSVSPQPKEIDRRNNLETRHISVREGKIRVLLADSLPRWEFRALKTLLERERTIQLHTVLQDADSEYADQDRSAKTLKGRFPVKRDQLFEYDVIIFGDLDPKYLSYGIFKNLRDFVRDAGGGLIIVAGEQHNPHAYRGTPLEVVLPIDLSAARKPSSGLPIPDSFQPELTLAGRKATKIFRFAETEQDSLAAWGSLPGLYWLFEAPKRKTGAVVFAQHPTRTESEGKLPVIVWQRFGAGKVLFHCTDELWRWRFRTGDFYYGRYWIQAIRHLSRSRLLGQSRDAKLATDRLVYQHGETVQFRMKFFDERHVPLEKDGVTVKVECRDDVGQNIKLTRVPEVPTVFEGQFQPASKGSFHAFVTIPSFKQSPPSTDFRVKTFRRELQNRSLDRAELTQTAKVTHGRFYTIANASHLPDDIPRGQPVLLETVALIPLWNRWEAMVVFAILLLGEWLLRKRFRLI